MRIGLTGGGSSVQKIIAQARQAEADGFSSLWYASSVAGYPLVAMALAGRETTAIELGTAVLQTYPCHPLLQANRAAAVASAMDRPGLVLGIGPSHEPIVRGVYGLSYDHPGRSTEEYTVILTRALRGQPVDLDGADWTAHSADRVAAAPHPVPVLLAALGPRLLRVAGEVADGTITWLATARAIESSIAPRIRAAAAAAGRRDPRIVAGLPVAVHDDEAQARVTAASVSYAAMDNYRRVMDLGGAASAADAAIVGDEASVTAQLRALIGAGATDIWAAVFAVGDDRPSRAASVRRTTGLLRELVSKP